MRTKQGLTKEDLLEVKRLIDRCNRHEKLDLSFNLEAGHDPINLPKHFLSYEGEHLVGAASLQGNREVEVCLVVHPDHRRRGIGRGLLQIVCKDLKRRGLASFLLVCEDTSRSGRAFVTAVGGQYRFSEYRMRLDPRSVPRPQAAAQPILRWADARDIDVLARLISTSFGRSEDQERARVARDLQRSTHRFL
ncbi:MAG: GNAT family N-acetyltransferase, partial [bacterium]